MANVLCWLCTIQLEGGREGGIGEWTRAEEREREGGGERERERERRERGREGGERGLRSLVH